MTGRLAVAALILLALTRSAAAAELLVPLITSALSASLAGSGLATVGVSIAVGVATIATSRRLTVLDDAP